VKVRLARAYAMNGNRALALTYIDSVGQLATAGAQPAMLTGATEFETLKSDSRFASALAKIEAIRLVVIDSRAPLAYLVSNVSVVSPPVGSWKMAVNVALRLFGNDR
jgi:hypothetical protein